MAKNQSDDQIDYKKSGVDVQAGDDLVDWLHQDDCQNQSNPENNEISEFSSEISKEIIKINQSVQIKLKERVVSGIGGFAALFNAQFEDIKNPLLVSCTDGVGTKVKVASYFNEYSTVGYDLVAMCANDLICTGGRPLFFLDYYATGKLNLDHAKQFLTSVKKACVESQMILIGGETAEMPGVYQPNDFDCAGFSVGVVDRDKTWGADRVSSGDVVIGLHSSGFHSNGYSLIRKIFEGQFDQYRDWLMAPTRLYVLAAQELQKQVSIKAACHITGGGIENIPRVLPDHLKVVLKIWQMPDCFLHVQKKSGMTTDQMLKTLNCGMGFMFIVPAPQAQTAQTVLNQFGYSNEILGLVKEKQNQQGESVEFC